MSKVESKKNEKRARIVNGALQLFNLKGFAHTKIDDIVAQAGVGKGTFYLYFQNKEHLVQSVLESMASDLIQTLLWVDEQRLTNPDMKEIFRQEGQRLATTLGRSKDVAVFIFKQARGVSMELDQMVQEFMDTIIEICQTHFEQAIEKGQVNQNLNPQITALSIIGGIHFTYQQWACGHVTMEVESVVEALLTFYLNALGLR